MLVNSELHKYGPANLNILEARENAYKCFRLYQVRDSVQDIFDNPKISDPAQTSNFWLLCAALHRFFEKNEALPQSGKVSDMTSTTNYFLDLQRM